MTLTTFINTIKTRINGVQINFSNKIYLNNLNINYLSHFKDLGTIFASEMLFYQHIEYFLNPNTFNKLEFCNWADNLLSTEFKFFCFLFSYIYKYAFLGYKN